jgi:hypothetical protein
MKISQRYTEQVARFVVETRVDTIPREVGRELGVRFSYCVIGRAKN